MGKSDCVGLVTDRKDDTSNDNCFRLIGEHENQVSVCGEVDLHQHVANCKKNPGHPEFIPIESFSLKHLPEGHRDSDLYELIKATADLTVRLSVTMTSPGRPEFWPNTKIPYFLSDLRGKKTLRTGSGTVWAVRKYAVKRKKMDYKYKTCPCDKCKDSDKASKVWWNIDVQTAAHVIVDDIEASHMTVTFFYDSEDSEFVVLKENVFDHYVSIERDCSMFTCLTCDEDLGKILQNMWNHFVRVCVHVRKKYIKNRDIHKLSFIVSHPHGCSKQVSLGHWKDKIQTDEYNNHRFTYTTCTCPGSSGATVHCLGYNGLYTDHVHSGSLRSGINYSAVGWVFPLS